MSEANDPAVCWRVYDEHADTICFDNGKDDGIVYVRSERDDGLIAIYECGDALLTPDNARLLAQRLLAWTGGDACERA